jgi:hypothetical protein
MKFQYSTLDILEMRAVAHVLPSWGSGSPKAEWRDDFMRKLNEYAHAECIQKLPEDARRNKADEVDQTLLIICLFSSKCVRTSF